MAADAPPEPAEPGPASGEDAPPEPAEARPSRPRRPRPRRDVFERLAQDANPPWQVGDRVLVRDKPAESDWLPGVVVSVSPVQVRLKGGRMAFTWRDIKANAESRSPSPSPTSVREPNSPSLRPASAQALRRARALSKRRRRREKEAKQKELETQQVAQMMLQRATENPRLPTAAQQSKQDQVRHLRKAVDQVCMAMDEAAAGKKKAPSAYDAEKELERSLAKSASRAYLAKVQDQCLKAVGSSELQQKQLQTMAEHAQRHPEMQRPRLSPVSAPAAGSRNPSKAAPPAKVQRLARGLAGYGVKLRDTVHLTVKERKKLLDFLGHPYPGGATEPDAFVEWLRLQLWLRRARSGPGEPERLKESKQADLSMLHLVRNRVKAAQLDEDDPKENLTSLMGALSSSRMELDALLCIPQKEFKKLAEQLGVKMQGMTKEDVVEKLKQQVWASRTKFAKMKGLADLTFEPRSQVLQELRRALLAAEEQLQKPVTAAKLCEWLEHYHLEYYQLEINNLSLLTVQELRKLTHWMDMPPLRGRAEILEWLHQDLWSERAVRRVPSKAKLRFLRELSAARQKVVEELDAEATEAAEAPPATSTVLLDDDGAELRMEYDMFVPP